METKLVLKEKLETITLENVEFNDASSLTKGIGGDESEYERMRDMDD